MSYSRWPNSCWYTFWTSLSEDTEFKLPTQRLKDNQVFEICDFEPYYVKYDMIQKLGTKKITQIVQQHYQKETPPKTYTQEELDELERYLKEFVKDVDKQFQFKNFFYYSWLLPIKRKIKLLI